MNGNFVYLDNALMGLVDNRVKEKIMKYLDMITMINKSPTQISIDMYNTMPEARKKVGMLLNVDENTIALVESTSHALGMIANAINLDENDNVLVCDLEFLSSNLCWKAAQDKKRFEIRKVKTKNGQVKAEDFEKVIDKRTRAIVISAVQESNGYRSDIKELKELAEKYNSYLIVDGIQEVGAMEVDLSKIEVDFYCSGGHKWLRNPFGCGFMYINPKIINDINPEIYGYFNLEEPKGGWKEYLESPKKTPFDEQIITKNANKFETGSTGNYIGAIGLAENIDIILETGINKIENRIIELGNLIINGVENLGFKITSGKEQKHRSGIVSCSLGDIQKEKGLIEYLHNNNIYISLRYTNYQGGLRISPHYYNNEEDVNYLIEHIKKYLESRVGHKCFKQV